MTSFNQKEMEITKEKSILKEENTILLEKQSEIKKENLILSEENV